MTEIHHRRPRRYKCECSFIGNDRRPSQKSGTRRENRNSLIRFSRFVPDHPRGSEISVISRKEAGAPNENMVQNHLKIALLDVF